MPVLDEGDVVEHPGAGRAAAYPGAARVAGNPESGEGEARMATTAVDTPGGRDADTARADRRWTAGGLLLGLGLGGFVDGIVLHQILQWHHMLTDHGAGAAFPASTVASLEHNTLGDGFFHLGTLAFVTAGLVVLWRAMAAGYRAGWRSLAGLLLAGWGVFNLVEGVVDHHVLGLHHVRDDVADPRWWDLGFLALGALLVAAGSVLRRSDPQRASARPDRPTSP